MRFRNFLLNETKAKMNTKVDKFTQAYIDAALWSSLDDNNEPLDKNYAINDFSEDSLKKIKADCQKFQDENSEKYIEGGWDEEQAGHDFWLTRNGHGAGFWDRTENAGYDEKLGKELKEKSQKFGEQDIYIGDDERLHI